MLVIYLYFYSLLVDTIHVASRKFKKRKQAMAKNLCKIELLLFKINYKRKNLKLAEAEGLFSELQLELLEMELDELENELASRTMVKG